MEGGKEPAESLALADEYVGLIWDPRSQPGKRVEHPSCPNHLADAALYAWRKAYHYQSTRQPAPPPVAGTDEWLQAEADRMREEAEASMRGRVGEPVGLADMAESMAEWDPLLH